MQLNQAMHQLHIPSSTDSTCDPIIKTIWHAYLPTDKLMCALASETNQRQQYEK